MPLLPAQSWRGLTLLSGKPVSSSQHCRAYAHWENGLGRKLVGEAWGAPSPQQLRWADNSSAAGSCNIPHTHAFEASYVLMLVALVKVGMELVSPSQLEMLSTKSAI